MPQATNSTLMKIKKIIILLVILGLAAAVVIKLVSNKQNADSNVYQFDKTQPLHVQTDTVQTETIYGEINYSGSFEPFKETKLSADFQGKVMSVLVDIGSEVKKGQTLIQLDNSLLKLQLETVNIQIQGIESDVNRLKILAAADAVQGVQLEKAELGLQTAKIQRATIQEQINKTSIKAPFSGIVTAKLIEEGGFAAPGIPLLQLTDISQLKFSINVPEHDLLNFKLNQVCEIETDLYPELTFTGTTNMIGSKANPGNSFPIQFLVKNSSDKKIKSGMYGKIILKKDDAKSGVIISSSAIQGSSDHPKVYVVRDGKAILQEVTIVANKANSVIISSGLSDGDILITGGFINLFDGANVSSN